jgi:D-alanyl-lipoteichoic acid acyltransferase DltB (MBOAT superfamily)
MTNVVKFPKGGFSALHVARAAAFGVCIGAAVFEKPPRLENLATFGLLFLDAPKVRSGPIDTASDFPSGGFYRPKDRIF